MINRIFQSYWFRSGSLTLLNRISNVLFGLLYFYFLIRVLQPDAFGAWVIFLTITSLSESIRVAFIYNPLLKYLNSSEKESHSEILGASLALNFLAAVAIAVVFVLLSFVVGEIFDTPELGEMLLVSIISVFGFTLFAHFNFLQQANKKFTGTFISTFVQKLILLLYILYLFIFDTDTLLITIVFVYSIGYVISSLVSYLFVRNQNALKIKFNRNWMLRLFHYGKYTLGTNVSAMLNKNTKEWFLGGMLGTASVAIFSPAVKITNLFEVPLSALAPVFYPEMISRVRKDGLSAAKLMYEKSVAYILIAIVPSVIIILVFAEPIVLFIAGPEYPAAIPVLQIMVFYGLFEPFQRQFGITLNAIGKAHINFYFIVISSAIGIIISFIFIKLYGILGAAYGTIITYALGALVIQYLLYRQLQVNTWNIFKLSFSISKNSIRLAANLIFKRNLQKD